LSQWWWWPDCGIAAYVKRLRHTSRSLVSEPVDADAMAALSRAGDRVRLQQVGLFADGVAVKYSALRLLEYVRSW